MICTSSLKCSSCDSQQENTITLPFGRIICDKCSEIQCLSTSDQLESHFGNQKFDLQKIKSPPQDMPKNVNIGITLYGLKQSLDNLQFDIKNCNKKINDKIDMIKLEIDINLNYCLEKLANKKGSDMNQMIIYTKQIMDRIDTKKLIRLKSQLALHIDYFNKLKNGLMTSETEIENFIRTLNTHLQESNEVIFSNSVLSYDKPRSLKFNMNELGQITFSESKKNEKTTDSKTFLSTSPYFNMQPFAKNYLRFKNVHIFKNNIIIVYENSSKHYQLNLFQWESSELKYELKFPMIKLSFFTCSDLDYLLICDSDDLNSWDLTQYDENLNMVKKTRISNLKPIDFFLNKHLYFITEKPELEIKIYNADLQETKSIALGNISLFNDDINETEFKLIMIHDCICLKHKTLLGTRLNFINAKSGQTTLQLDIAYFFSQFYFDMEFKILLFFCNATFYFYDVKLNKIVQKVNYKNLENCHCVFDYSDKDEVYALITCLD